MTKRKWNRRARRRKINALMIIQICLHLYCPKSFLSTFHSLLHSLRFLSAMCANHFLSVFVCFSTDLTFSSRLADVNFSKSFATNSWEQCDKMITLRIFRSDPLFFLIPFRLFLFHFSVFLSTFVFSLSLSRF